MIKIARNGKEIGACEPEQLENLISQDIARTTDHYWQTGMNEWRPVSEILNELNTQKKQQRLRRIKLAAVGILILVTITLTSILLASSLNDFDDNSATNDAANRERAITQKIESERRAAIKKREQEAAQILEQEADRLARIKELERVNNSIGALIGEFIITPPDKFEKGSVSWYRHKNVENYWKTNLRVLVNEDGYFYFETILKGYFSEGHSIIRNDSFIVLIDGNTVNSGVGEVDDVEISSGTFFERVSYNSTNHQGLARLIASACEKGSKLEFRMNGKRGKFRDIELKSEDAVAFSQSVKLADLLARKKQLSGK